MLKHNSYFGNRVQSVGLERHGRRQTIGAMDAGEFHFDTDTPERMHVLSGEIWVRVEGMSEYQLYPAGTSFEVGAKSGFDVRADLPVAYLCEYL
jgi:purine/pyrimidine-nucleoside phosphorylase